MASIPLLIEAELERLSAPTPIDSFGGYSVSQAFTAVAQEIVELLKQSQPLRTDSVHRTEMVMIRAIEPEYKEVMAIGLLTTRELEVLQLIVAGYNNPTIAGKLHITRGTVKTHVRNLLKKLYVNEPPVEELR